MGTDDIMELVGYWKDHPPLHLMVAAYLGIKPREVQQAEGKAYLGSAKKAKKAPPKTRAMIDMVKKEMKKNDA